ncbi:uncharacterized protein LOC141879422 isoform X1 [Acropora palmata]|uniref:uncharacterized protein LOC141879422 isoform X1 n=1 Tax=Acropora palmata TaxID=6131 RepID=UPI003DA1394D
MTKGDFIEDWSSCVKCGRNKGIYGSNYILIHQGCEQCRQTSYTLGNPCVLSTKNFKCRPWRRKSLSESVSKGPCPDSLLSTTFLLLFVCTNIVQGVSYFLQKASSFKRDTNILWQFLLVGLLGGFMFPLVSCQEGLPNAVVYTGSVFTYNIPEDVFGCEVDSIVVSESVDRYLSHWLAYNSDKKQLYGVPSEKEKGTYNLLVVALTKDGKVGSHVCGSRSFSVKVLPANDELPASIHFGLGTSNKDDSNALRSPCNPGMQVVQGTAILNANMESLNGHERMTLILKMSDHLGVSLSRVSFFAGHASHPIIDKLDSPAVMAAGAGDGRFAKGSKSLLTWHIGCGAIKLDDLALSKLEADAQDGTISSLLGFPVFGWHVMSGTQRNQARHRVRRQAIRVPVTETPTSYTAPPSRLSNVSTSVIVSPTVKITSVFRGNSTIQLSAPGASSLVQNRTVIATSSAVNISRTMSLGMQSSGQILSSSAVSMSRSSSSAVSMSRSSESLQLQPSGNSTLHLASSSFLHSSLNSSFMTRTATVNVSSSAISSLLLPTTDMTNISSSIVVTPNHTMASVSQAAPISSVDRTFITLFISPTSYSSWISSRSTAQVNNSVFPRMSSFAVSLVSPSSVLSSAFRNLTTLFASSEIKLSTMQLNVSKAMLPTLSALPTSSPAPGLSSSFTSHNISSALTTALLYQTSSINIVSSLASLSPISSSLFESTVVKNLSSGIEAMNRTSILDKTATTLMQPTTNIVPIVTSIIVPTMPTLVTKTSYFATWPFKSSTVILSIPLFHSSSPALLWSSSVITSMSTVSKNFTSTAPLQPNVPSTEVLRSSLTASPVVTSLKLTSMVTSKSASGVLGNSTLKIIRSSPTLKTTSALSPMRTTAGETFLVTSASSRTPITSLTLEVDKSTTFTLPLASVSPVLRSSLADVSSTVSSRTWGSLSIAVMQSANESIESIATRKRLTTFSTQIGKSAASLPSSNTLFPGSSTSTSAFPSSKAFFVSSTILLQNSSTAVTLVKSTLSPGSLVVLSSTVVPSFTTSSLAQQSQNATAKSRTVFSITSFKITTTNLQTRRTVSSRSSLSRSSSLGINASASVTPASRTGTPTTETVTPSSLHTQFESIFSSFTGLATSVVVSTSVFSRSTASPVNSGSNYVSSRVPSSAQSSATFPPVNRTSRSIRKTIGFSSLASRNTTQATPSRTVLKSSSSFELTGSRVTTITQSSLSLKRSTIYMSSKTVTPSVTIESSAILGRPSFVQRSLSSKVTQSQSSVLTSTWSSGVTQGRSFAMEKSASRKSHTLGTIGSETVSRPSAHKNSVTFTTISTGFSSLVSRNTTQVTPSRTVLKTTSSFALAGSRMTTITQSSLSLKRSTIFMASKTVTPSLTIESSAMPGRPSFVQRSLSSKVTQTHSSVFTGLTTTLSFGVTQVSSSAMQKSASRKSRTLGTISSETQSSLSAQVSRIEATQATSTHENSITFTTISTETSSVMSSIPSVTSSQQTTVEYFLSRPSQTSSAIVVRSSNTQASSPSEVLVVISRVTASGTPSVTSSIVVNVASSFQSVVTPPSFLPSSDTSRLFFTTSVKSRISSVRSRLISGTQSSHLLSSETVSSSNLAPSSDKASSRQVSISASFSTMATAKGIHSTRRIQIPETSVIRPSSPSERSSELSAKPSLEIRISTRFESAASFVSNTPRDSSTVVRLSNSTQIIMPTGSAMTQSVTSSSSIVRPTTERPNSPPKVYNEMGRVSAPAGKALYLRIPDDTFYDSEDRATTRNLSLSVGFASGDSIPSDFWLQFDNKTQTIYGLPLDAHVRSGVSGESLVLRARDSQGDEALDAFEVLVVPSEKPVVQELTLRISNNFRIFISNVSQRLLLLEKIAAFYGDSDSSQIRVLSFTAGSVIMEWTNDSLPTDTCDEEKIQFVENRILEDGEVREEFKEALRDFLVENATQIRMGVCKGTRPGDETTIAPAQQSRIEESNLWYKHVLIGLLFVLIILVLVSILVWYRRRRRSKPYNEKRTFKKRKPIILGQEIELEPIAGKALVLPDDDPSQPPSYLSETSLAKPVSSDDDDEEDYGKSPSIRYQPPPPFHAALTEDPRSSPPPAYMMPPMY